MPLTCKYCWSEFIGNKYHPLCCSKCGAPISFSPYEIDICGNALTRKNIDDVFEYLYERLPCSGEITIESCAWGYRKMHDFYEGYYHQRDGNGKLFLCMYDPIGGTPVCMYPSRDVERGEMNFMYCDVLVAKICNFSVCI